MATRPHAKSAIPQHSPAPARRWLLFVHQLPTSNSNLRVRTWRRLQQLGAMPIKQAVYVLPDTPAAREDFEWLKAEVKGAGGDATVFVADHVDTWSDDALVEEFRRSRQDAYAELGRDIGDAVARSLAAPRPRGPRAPALSRLVDLFRERLTAIEAIDFFGSAGRDRAIQLLADLEKSMEARAKGSASAARSTGVQADRVGYQGRIWVTRPRPGVDRMASAWLIKRFIDPKARFAFALDREAVAGNAVPFDMFGIEFGHQGDGCTFETLCAAFSIDEPAVSRVAAIVHDLDLKDARFGATEAPTVSAMIEGLQLAHGDDEELLQHGMTLFDALYRSFEQAVRSVGPRPLARGRQPRPAPKASSRKARRPRRR